MANLVGRVYRVNGPVVELEGVTNLKMLDMVQVGPQRLIGEVVRLKGDHGFVQVYEDTTSLRAGDEVYSEGFPLFVELGPGLLGNIYDGIQRPLEVMRKKQGVFIQRGMHNRSLDTEKKWHFVPLVQTGKEVSGGEVIGQVQETARILHKIMVPVNIKGKIIAIKPEGDYVIDEEIAVIVDEKGKEYKIPMVQLWPVRRPRPYLKRLSLEEPLLTGQRVIDTLFPVAKGGCVAVPGGFGTGKTVIQHQVAKWSDADIVIYVGCGERGNEMTDVLLNFPNLIDPRTQRPLSERTIFIANTSNMPVAAREASIYTGITLAEYYRDMGYHVALMADSTSRWAEALRELSGRLEEMPLEEGFPAYLPSRLAEFYERAGKVKTLSNDYGSITIIAAVSPQGGDFSEPVTSHTKRFIRCFWALDRELANSRHYPAISWIDSYSEYLEDVKNWWHRQISPEWEKLRQNIMELLQKEQRLLQVVKLVGTDVLPPSQRLVLEVCSLFKNGFLQQVAFDQIDTYSSARKQFLMLKSIITFYQQADGLIKKGISIEELREQPIFNEIMRMRQKFSEDMLEELNNFPRKVEETLRELDL
ncbi:MAG: V-type ATP synthase subunit A [Candidatus Omnitrophica bacterium]|nr:V-type ATP synthase subunit A [Candidatus Omnitrophota bacterium]